MFELTDLKLRRRAWVRASRVPTNRLGWTLEDCTEVDPADLAEVRKWVDAFNDGSIVRAVGNRRCGIGLLFWGEPGHGKTTLALAVIQEIMSKSPWEAFNVTSGSALVRPCFFSTYNDILDLQGSIIGGEASSDDEVLMQGMLGNCADDAYNIRVLIIDDLGKEHASVSGWQRDFFHHVLRTRFNNGLPTIVTTNIRRERWGATYGDATESFANEAFKYVAIVTRDMRTE